MIDSHTHLEMCEAADAELVAEAEAAGVTRILTIGIDGASCRAALAAAEAFPQVRAAIGRHPNGAKGFDDADLAELQALAAHERCAAIGETGLDYYRDSAPPEDQLRAFEAHVDLARDIGKPLVIHTRAAEDDTLAVLRERAEGIAVVMHCFSMPDRLDECLEHGWWISFAGNVTYPSAAELAPKPRSAFPRTGCSSRPTLPSSLRSRCAASATGRSHVTHTARFVADARGVSYEELERTVDANASRLFGW